MPVAVSLATSVPTSSKTDLPRLLHVLGDRAATATGRCADLTPIRRSDQYGSAPPDRRPDRRRCPNRIEMAGRFGGQRRPSVGMLMR
jgi:hypothetical protein